MGIGLLRANKCGQQIEVVGMGNRGLQSPVGGSGHGSTGALRGKRCAGVMGVNDKSDDTHYKW